MAEVDKEKLIISPESSPEEDIHDILVEKKDSLPSTEQVTEKVTELRVEEGKESADVETAPSVEQGPAIDDQIKIKDGAVVAPPTDLTYQQERIKQIDKILADGLDKIYLQMPPNVQQEFKKKGEETAIKINSLLQKTKVKINKIFLLIKNWLKIIPGVNKLFLEREAKIKTDQIIDLNKKNN